MLNNLYLPMQTINVPEDNDAFLTFDVLDEDQDPVDISEATEIKFVVYDERGGNAEFSKSLSGADISILGSGYQFSVWIDAVNTQSLTNRMSYHECQVTQEDGRKRTISAGLFRAENTYIWEL